MISDQGVMPTENLRLADGVVKNRSRPRNSLWMPATKKVSPPSTQYVLPLFPKTSKALHAKSVAERRGKAARLFRKQEPLHRRCPLNALDTH
jgi:hypothetical protein